MSNIIFVDSCEKEDARERLLGDLEMKLLRKPVEVNRDRGGLLKGIECFALDMDGTIYLGEQWIDGAMDFLKRSEEHTSELQSPS